ncbi:AAA domain-containing protein [Neisseria weaveri]|uniref:Serine/threonine protein kinase n=1 Tax=Neisseria weaveri TaxID=28091 RepID=A0A3S4ZDE7_9NEIS|nr:AAA domain-containing protein [Neisseria weaveri]EGV35174.1 superfamily I DNA and RNA helicase and helicase subunit [Neisseria weaveri LMG 5135]VEJ51305.1 serine/threonine protein kinase [Neisseria weaveri]
MKVQDWGGGLIAHEVEAIAKMKQAFQAASSNNKVKGKGFEALKSLQSMFPWQGYSGFRFVDGSKEGEFDLVIVTHCNVLIVELKDWNNGVITSQNDKWFLGNQDRGRSPVSVTRDKKFLLEKKLEKFKHQFTNKGYRPHVEFLVVMTGNADLSQLPESEKLHVLSLKDFLALKDEHQFNKRFRPHPNSRTLNQDFAIFDNKIFGTDKVKPRTISYGGYSAESIFDQPDFQHPKGIYREFFAKSENKKQQDIALLRRWDFTRIDNPQAQTPDGRYRLVSREYDVLQHIKSYNPDLYNACLNYKNMPQKGKITAEHIDLFELYPQQKRFNQFVGGHSIQNLNEERRLGLVQILLDKFTKLHKIGIAHRDLGEHSIWLSADDKISLSGFATAYFSSEQTVGDIRQLLEVSGDLAKIIFPFSDDIKPTPYQYDVRSLAVLAWHLMNAERISPASLEKMAKTLPNETTWYAAILRTALSNTPFKNAGTFLDAFNQAKPEQSLDFAFDFGKLEQFYQEISHSRAYREDDNFIVETSEKEVYRSNGMLVKAWLGTDPKQDSNAARVALVWLENMAKLTQISPDYLPKIHNFGIARKSSSLFAVSEFIDGQTWSEIARLDNLTENHKLFLINQLLHAIEHLHSLGFTHGDLKPENVFIAIHEENSQLYLLDILDFVANGETLFNTEYSPVFDNATEKQRDNFAVMKMACELLGVAWNMPSEKFADIAEVVQLENSDKKSGFISLARFQTALTPKPSVPMIEIDIGGRDSFDDVAIYPENGELFVQFEKSKKDDVLIKLIGLGGIAKLFYSINEKKLTHGIAPISRNYVSRNDKENSELSLPISLKIVSGRSSNLNELNQYLANHESFNHLIGQFIAKHIFRQPENEILPIKVIDGQTISETATEPKIISERPRIHDLWQAILNTETESLPSISASDDLQKTENDEIYIPYEGEIDPTEQFKKDETVEAIGRDDKTDKEFKYGTVDIAKSNLKELHLKSKKLGNAANRITEGTPIYLQSVQNKASFKRRKNALQRILDNESVIKNLVQYFDEDCEQPAHDYKIIVSDEDFALYDRQDDNNKTISLNDAQRQAFQRLISHGPLSLLQGPPGTGKTEFIAAFVHYLFEKQKVNNILLVSQSHEAVNTAAERIRKHCQRLGTSLDIVRFSNREVADSETLEDVFSFNLVGQKRRQLEVNKINNIRQMGRAMGLPESYLLERAEIQFGIGKQIRRYEKIVNNSSSDETADEDEKAMRKDIERAIREQAKALNIVDNMLAIQDILPKLVQELDVKHNVQPAESIQAGKLIGLTRNMLEALSNDRTNYDEFLARSRQLVVGTCVGIGQPHIGIAENLYDWVIVDEAARSISSELAIAMQSGKRILLVGDHKQLPPLYSTEHKNALARRLGISVRGEELDQALGSDFERVFQSKYGKQTCATLKTQYRMAPAIGSLVSACFYDGVLENGKTDENVPNIYFRLPEYFQNNVTWLDTSKLPNSYHQANKSSFSNRAEADTIIGLLNDMANDETFMESEIVQKCLAKNEQAIGVICMYAEQKKLIRSMFNQKTWDSNFRDLVKIDSVDSYQGKENRVIILSLSRHDKECSTGFLYLPNRINVALSRAMDKLIIVGAAAVWEHPKNAKTPLSKVLNYIKKNAKSGQYQFKSLANKGIKK